MITKEDKENITNYIKLKVKLILNEKMTLIPSTI